MRCSAAREAAETLAGVPDLGECSSSVVSWSDLGPAMVVTLSVVKN